MSQLNPAEIISLQNLSEIKVVEITSTYIKAIVPNLAIERNGVFLSMVINFQFKDCYKVDTSYLCKNIFGLPDFEIWSTRHRDQLTNIDTCLFEEFEYGKQFCHEYLDLLVKEHGLIDVNNLVILVAKAAEKVYYFASEYWAVAQLKVAAHNYLLDDKLIIGKILSLKLNRGKLYVKYSLPQSNLGTKSGHTILSFKKVYEASRNHFDITPILDNYEYENKSYKSQSPFVGFNVFLKSGQIHDGYLVPVNNGLNWIKIERNQPLRKEPETINRYLDTTNEKYRMTLGDNFPLEYLASDIYEAYIQARDAENIQDIHKMDFHSTHFTESYKSAYIHYKNGLKKETETRAKSFAKN